MDREQLLLEADDLERLCQPRELATHEVFAPNAFYGNDIVLKRYAGLPPDSPLKVVVPHGIVFDGTYVWTAERQAPLPAVLAYGDHRALAYSRSTRKLLIRSAVPFAYLAKMLGEAQKPRSGTLYFPGHSSHRATAQSDFEGMAERLAVLESRFRPVTVCVYWRDFELGRHVPFVERGLRVVSAGHIYDPAFLFRLYYLCQQHRYAASNDVGSILAYSVLAGCSFFLLSEFRVTYTGEADHLATDLPDGGEVLDTVAAAFAAPVDEISEYQSGLVHAICGLDDLLSERELHDVLGMAERLDRYGVARDPHDRRFHLAVPRRYQRAGQDLVRGARRRVGAVVRPERSDRRSRA